MKKILITLIAVLVAGLVSAQNTFKYEIKANGGITVGTGGSKIDSLVRSGTTLRMYNGATELTATPSAHTQGQTTITGLPDSLLNHYTKAQVNTRLNLKANTSHTQAQTTITALPDSLLGRYTKTQANTRFLGKSDTAGMLNKYMRDYEKGRITKGYFNVLDYGATDGGTVEDATAIQNAINAATDFIAESEDGGGTVIIPSGVWYVNKPDTLKSNIHIKIDKNAQFRFPSSYNGAMWVNDTTDLLVRCTIEGGRFYEPNNTFTFAKLYSSQLSNYVMFVKFKDCYVERANIVFDLRTFGTGWINGNTFDNIIGWCPVEFLKMVDSETNSGMDGNIFSNCQVQPYNGVTTHAIHDLAGSYNLFSNFVMWDADAFSVGINITDNGAYNTIIGSLIPKNKYVNATPTNYNLCISDGQILSGYEIFNSDNDTTLLGDDIVNMVGGKIYAPDQIIIHGRSEVKDTIDKLVVSHSSDAGTSGTPAGDIAIKLKSYAEYPDDYAGANRAARIMSRNSAGSDYVSWLYLQTHGTGSSESYVDALRLSPSGGVRLTISGIPTYADNAAALGGGLVAGDIYRTSTGQLMIVYTP